MSLGKFRGTYRWEDLPEVQRRLIEGNILSARIGMRRGGRKIAQFFKMTYQSRIKRTTGTLAKGFKSRLDSQGNVVVYNNVPYWASVEDGKGPGTSGPPWRRTIARVGLPTDSNPILHWALRKGILTDESGNKSGLRRMLFRARMIRKKIKLRGTTPKRIMATIPTEKINSIMVGEVLRELKRS